MDIQTAISKLNNEWELEGFFGKIRAGEFDNHGLERVINILESTRIEDDNLIDRRFISLTWFIPIFLEWNKSNVEKGSGSPDVDKSLDRIMPLLYKLLGIP